MSQLIDVNEPDDIVWTMSREGFLSAHRVLMDGTLVEISVEDGIKEAR